MKFFQKRLNFLFFIRFLSGSSCANSSFPSISFVENSTIVEPDNQERLSNLDIEQINFLYGCESIVDEKTAFGAFGTELVMKKFVPHFLSFQGRLTKFLFFSEEESLLAKVAFWRKIPSYRKIIATKSPISGIKTLNF